MSKLIPYTAIMERMKGDIEFIAEQAYAKGKAEGRKKGKWIEHDWAEKVGEIFISNYECDQCHEWEREKSDFCPNCGADMREGEQDDSV